MRIGLLSDTHGYLDDRILTLLGECDEIWHAGDFGNAEVSDQLTAIKPLRGVYGNIDGKDIRVLHPKNLLFESEGMKVLMTHIGGYPGRYNLEAKKLIEQHEPGLFICGHSHILKVMPDSKHQLLHLNPGAAGKHGFHKVRTMLRFSITEGKLQDLQVVELGKRA